MKLHKLQIKIALYTFNVNDTTLCQTERLNLTNINVKLAE